MNSTFGKKFLIVLFMPAKLVFGVSLTTALYTNFTIIYLLGIDHPVSVFLGTVCPFDLQITNFLHLWKFFPPLYT